jgi:hypothetical protein
MSDREHFFLVEGEGRIGREEFEEIVTGVIHKAFRDVGLDPSTAFELRKDLNFLRDWRETCELVKSRGIISGVTLIFAALATVLLIGVKGWFFQ